MERRAITVAGIVQGVGFRPFVHSLAAQLRLTGFVKNRAGSVLIEVEGEAPVLDHFLSELTTRPPPLARIEDVRCESRPAQGSFQFDIETSDLASGGSIFVSPDVATCADCLAEMLDPSDRRYRYPFLNCTHCGPRLTIIRAAPYDRRRTTMAEFAMCAACRREYKDPSNRRFHAQPTCCPACGPQLRLLDGLGLTIAAADPLAEFAARLQAGQIGALKGLGGYHLVCDARNDSAVCALRSRKHRHEKPFALMVADLLTAETLCQVAPAERALLGSGRRPIVLLRRRPGACVAAACAPGNPFLGIMLPYTPLHHLLVRAMAGIPLIMTSGNRADEPIATEDSDAVQRLAGIADVFLTHNRPIHVRCDDSVTRWAGGSELPLRRSRGYAPLPVSLPIECRVPILGVGGQLKSTFALGQGRQAFLSHHLGDLDEFAALEAFERDVGLYESLFDLRPQVLVHDLHPDYASTSYAMRRAAGEPVGPASSNEAGSEAVRLLAVQHHHAHMASCMAENGLKGPAIGVIFDGAGFGSDGAIWGGEFLVGAYRSFQRAAHFRYVGMPGGEQAVREPWRMLLAFLKDAQLDSSFLATSVAAESIRVVDRLLENRFRTPLTSSVGRIFDGVAALLGSRVRVSHEGQAAIELEWQAMMAQPDGLYPYDIAGDWRPEAVGMEGTASRGSDSGSTWTIDSRPMFRAIAVEQSRAVWGPQIARRFHSTMADMIVKMCLLVRRKTALSDVVLSGGVFMNVLLLEEAIAALAQEDFRVHRHRVVPPNDGGLSLGQVAVAAAQL